MSGMQRSLDWKRISASPTTSMILDWQCITCFMFAGEYFPLDPYYMDEVWFQLIGQ